MSKKQYLRSNALDPNFKWPDTEASLQEKPVDFRSESQKPYLSGTALDSDFAWPDEIENKELKKKIDEQRISDDPYFTPIHTSQKDAQARTAIIDEQLSQARARLATHRNEIKKKDTLGKIMGWDKNFKYLKDVEQEIETLKEKRDKIFAEGDDVSAIDAELAQLEKERIEVSKQLEYEGPQFYPGGGLPGTNTPVNPEKQDELRQREQEIMDKESELKHKRKQLEYAATPLDGKEVQEIENSMGQHSGNIKNQDVIDKYGPDKVNRALREVTNFVYDDLADQHIEEQVKREDYGNMLTAEYAMYQGRKKENLYTPQLASEADKFFMDVSGTKEYKDANMLQKRKILAKAIQEKLADKYPPAIGEEADASKREQQIKDDTKAYTAYLSQRMMYDDKGENISLTGLQMMVEHINGDLVDRRIELENQRKSTWQANNFSNPDADMEERARFDEQYGANNVSLYFKQMDQEYKMVKDALEFNKKILDMNPQESRFRQFQTGLTSTPTKDLLTGGISEMNRMLRIADVAERGAEGEIDWTEAKLLETYALMNMANGSQEMTAGYRVGTQTSAMIPYVASFLATNPAYLAGKGATKAVVKGATRTVKAGLRREIVGAAKIPLGPKTAKIYGKKHLSPIELAGRMLERTGGVSAQTLMQPMLQTALARETMPEIQATFGKEYNDMYVRIEGKSPEEIQEGKQKARRETFSEIFTERMGAYIMKGLGITGANITSREAVKRYNLSKYIGLKKAMNPNKAVNKLVRKGMGWDGISEEYFEELANYFMANIATGEKPIQDGFWQQQLETLATVAIFGGAMKGINPFESYEVFRYGDNVRYSYKGKDGKKQKIVIPGGINQELKDIYETEDKYADPVSKLLMKYKDELSEKQMAFIMQLTGIKAAEKGVKKIIEKATKSPAEQITEQAGVKDTAAEDPDAVQQEIPFEQAEVTEGSPTGEIEISETEAAAIEKHNQEVVANNPDLAEAGLLITMPGGQMEVPTYEELLDRAEQINEELQDVTSQDELGQMKIAHEDAIVMLRQLEVLNQEIGKRAETEGIPFKYLMPSEQHYQLETELRNKQKRTGKVTRKGNKILSLQLEDGRVVKVITPPKAEKAQEKANEAVLNQEDVSLRIRKDKIAAVYDGKEIGFVESENFEYNRRLEDKQAELSQYIDDELELAKRLFRKASGTLASGIPLTPDHVEALKHLAKVVRYLIEKGITNVQQIVEQMKSRVRQSEKINTSQKQYWLDLIDNNIDLVTDMLRESLATKEKKFTPEQLEINFDNPDVAFLSGEQKKTVHLKTFNNIWKPVAAASGVAVEDVERQFYYMAQDPAFAQVSNDATYQSFLEAYISEDPMMSNLITLLSKRSFNEIVSAFNFYSSARLTKQVGVYIRDDGSINITTLNPSENYQDFINKFHSAVRNYTYKGLKGYAAIQKEIVDHRNEALKLQHGTGGVTAIADRSPAERIAARKEQHQKDLELLSRITGLTPAIWNRFFEDKKGTVRFAQRERGVEKRSEFETYEDLLEEDTFIKSFWRVQSDMIAGLQNMAKKSSSETFKEGLNSFFLRGKGKNLSNLYQLLTANQDRDELGLSGMDTKGDRFNSFIQFSHAFSIAEDLGREMVVLNGLHNLKENKNKKGTHSAKMSVEDIWFALAQLYGQRGDTYYQHMGQFGDKSSIHLIETAKIKPTTEDFEALRKIFPDFNEAVNKFYLDIVVPNSEHFSDLAEGKTAKERRQAFAKEFVYNYAIAMQEINKNFHGEIGQYEKGLVGMFKRGGSTISPGYRLNSNIEGGVGKSYRVLVVDDSNLGDKLPDGLSVGSSDFFDRIAVSMGEIYSKVKTEGFLTSVKALHSNVRNGKRGLMKTNNINIRALAMKHDKSIYQQLDAYMAKHKIDMITFTSGNKLTEIEGYEPISLFDKNGKFKDVSPKGKIFDRFTSDLYVQQDLRHSTTPKSTKMASQSLANLITLPEGQAIARIILDLQAASLIEIEDMLLAKGSDNLRMDWIKEAISEFSHPDVYRMIQAGVGINEPSIRNLLRTILSSQVSKYALDIPINRVTQQEIPDIDGILESRREYEGHVLLPDIAANITGVRAQWNEFLGKPDLAISHVIANKNQYRDLFDRDGNLMEWEITGRDGAIPGEPIVSTRVPADDLHSHTVARLRFNIGTRDEYSGNFTMLDNESRVASGSDFDGDARFNQVFFKDNQGNIILNNTKEGLSNQLLMEMVYGYSDPAMTERIKASVNPDAYNSIVDARRAEQGKEFADMFEGDLRAYMKAWERNKVGVDMKGILTDMNTLFSLASTHRIALKGIIGGWARYSPNGYEVSSQGDKRFSAFHAKLSDGRTIEKAYQEAKGSGKGKPSIYSDFDYWGTYLGLWKQWAKENPELIEELREKSEGKVLTDQFANTQNNQARALAEILEKEDGKIINPVTGKDLTRFIRDEHGQMKRHVANLLNMAFDNAKDPKIEDMGLNEVTVNMFMLALMTDPALSSTKFKTAQEHYDAIYKAIDKQTSYFTTPMMQDFISLVRRKNGGLNNRDNKWVWKVMGEKYKGKEKSLKKFFNQSQELPEIRNFFRLAQAAPKNAVELQMGFQLYDKIKNNAFDLFDTKGFFYGNTLALKDEYRIIPDMLSFMWDRIFYDSIENTEVGRTISEYILAKINEKKKEGYELDDLNKSQYDSISYLLNNILSVMAVNRDKSFYQVRKEAIQAFQQHELSGNLFMEHLQIIPRKGGPSLELIPEFTRAAINEVDMASIHRDFDKLPGDVKVKFIRYAVHRFGTTSSRKGGSFYSLISDKTKVNISEQNQKEIDAWDEGTLTPEQQYNIAKLLIFASKDPEVRELWGENEHDAKYYNVNVADPATGIPLDYNALESTEGAIDPDGIKHWLENYGLKEGTDKELADLIREGLGIEPGGQLTFAQHIIPWAKKVLEAKEKDINYFKNQNEQISDQELKDMVSEDVVGEALASDDPAIQEFILERMQAMYPEVEFFKSRDAFYSFLRKNGARLHNISPSAIGHALGNAVFADPTKAVQSTIIHEYAHVYWDALPEDHYTKTQLLRHFRSLPGNANLPDSMIEEQIIIAIGRSAFNIAEAGYNQSFTDKFVQLLRSFWASVKRLLGKINPEVELVNEMAHALWVNQDKINPQTITGQRVIKNMAEPEMEPYFDEKSNKYVVGGKHYDRVSMVSNFAKSNPFDSKAKALEMVQREASAYQEKHGYAMSPVDFISRVNAIEQGWKAEKEAGQLITAIAENVFGGEVVSETQIKNNFKNKEVYSELKKSLVKLRNALLEKYPEAEFETGVITFSENHKIAGKISLRVKVGDNKYVIVNFKTTKFPYRKGDSKLHDNYVRPYGSLKAPFPEGVPDSKQMENFIQTGLYAAMEEGRGRQIVEVLVVPIMRFTDKEGMIEGAFVANQMDKPLDNTVKVPWRDRSGKIHSRNHTLLKNLANAYRDNKNKNLSKPISNEKAMVEAGIDPEMAASQMSAEEFLAGMFEFENIQYTDIESLIGYGLGNMIGQLHELGFVDSDLRGPTAIDMKYLFFIAAEGVTKDQWEEAKHTEERTGTNPYITEVEVGSKFTATENTENTGQTKYHLNVGLRDLYMEESGHGNLEKNDEIVQIIESVNEEGEIVHRAFYYTVVSTNQKNKTIRAIDQSNGALVTLNSVSATSGTMKLIDQDDAIPKDSYQPKYKKERVPVREKQWRRLGKEYFGEDEKGFQEYLERMPIIDRFLNRYPTIESMREILGNKEKLERVYAGLRSSDNSQMDHFVRFLSGVLTSHYMAEQIRYEAKHMKLDQVKPAILSIYFYFNADEKAKSEMYSFDNPFMTKMFMPDRVIGGKHVPMHFIRRGVIEAYQEAMTQQIKLRNAMKPYLGKLEYDRIVETVYEGQYYKDPNTRGLSKDEKEFLSIVYEYHYTYDPYYKNLKRKGKGYPRQVKVSKMFATKGELTEQYGRRHGRILKDLLRPASYDEIEIDEIIINEFGEYEKTGRKTTLRKAKEQFSYIHGNDTANRQWLGTKWRHFISKVPGMDRVSPGILKHYQRIARRIYESKRHSDPTLLRKQSMIPLSGRGNPKYASKYFSEAEAKSIEGLIFEHHMGPVLAPMDHMMAHIKGDTDVAKWIKVYSDKIIFRQPADDLPEGVRMFINMLVRLNSLAKMAWQIRVQVKNFGIGLGMNLTRDTIPYIKGIKQATWTLFNPKAEQGFWKVVNIMKNTNLIMHMADDPKFDQLEKMLIKTSITGKARHRLPIWDRIIQNGYAPMTFFENMIQIPLLMGHMTEAEFKAYDTKGNLIDPENMITRARIHELREALRSVHGDYGPLNAAQFWQSSIGEAAFQFRKWGTAMFDKEFAAYQMDSNYKVRSGIFTTVGLLGNMIQWNRKDYKEKAARYKKMANEKAKKNQFDKVFFKGTKEYLDRLIIAQEGGKVTIRDLSVQDRRKLISAATQLATGVFYLVNQLFLGDDDDEIFKESPKDVSRIGKGVSNYVERKKMTADFWNKYLNRYGQDLYFMFATDQWQYVLENPLPTASITTNILKFSTEFIGWSLGFIEGSEIDLFGDDKIFHIHSNVAVYEKDSRYAREGWPKWIISGLGSAPMGSQVRSMMENNFYVMDARQTYDIQKIFTEAGIEQEFIDQTIERMGKPTMSELDIRVWSSWYDQFNRALDQGGAALAIKQKLEEKGFPATPYHIEEIIRTMDYLDDTTRQRKDLIKAIRGRSIHEQFLMGNFTDEEVAQIEAAIEAYQAQEEKKQIKTKSGKEREADKTLPVIEELAK